MAQWHTVLFFKRVYSLFAYKCVFGQTNVAKGDSQFFLGEQKNGI